MDSKSDLRMQSSLGKDQGFRRFRLFEWISNLRVPDESPISVSQATEQRIPFLDEAIHLAEYPI